MTIFSALTRACIQTAKGMVGIPTGEMIYTNSKIPAGLLTKLHGTSQSNMQENLTAGKFEVRGKFFITSSSEMANYFALQKAVDGSSPIIVEVAYDPKFTKRNDWKNTNSMPAEYCEHGNTVYISRIWKAEQEKVTITEIFAKTFKEEMEKK